jgi:hypothetical protein
MRKFRIPGRSRRDKGNGYHELGESDEEIDGGEEKY